MNNEFELFPGASQGMCVASGLDFYDFSEGNKAKLRKACDACPVFEACLSYSLPNEVYGWWANLSQKKRIETRKALGIPEPISVNELLGSPGRHTTLEQRERTREAAYDKKRRHDREYSASYRLKKKVNA